MLVCVQFPRCAEYGVDSIIVKYPKANIFLESGKYNIFIGSFFLLIRSLEEEKIIFWGVFWNLLGLAAVRIKYFYVKQQKRFIFEEYRIRLKVVYTNNLVF